MQILEKLKPIMTTEEHLPGRQAQNLHKNRDMNILASNKHRPYLKTQVPGRTDYINAVLIKVSNISFICFFKRICIICVKILHLGFQSRVFET